MNATQTPARKTRRSGRRLAIAGAGLVAAAGLGVFAVGGATGAMASTPGTVTGGSGAANNQVEAVVSVPAVTTLTLNSGALNFPTPSTLPGTVTATEGANASSNDMTGYTVQVASVSETPVAGQTSAGASHYDFLGHGNNWFPVTDLSVAGGTGGSFGEAAAPITTDASTAPGSNAISDTYSLTVPATAPADAAYTAWFAYTIAGN